MINKDRIVPIKLIDLLTLYGTILNIHGTTAEVLKSSDIEGDYTIPRDDMTYICDQPVKSIEFGDATTCVVYFVADEAAYEGFKINGVTPTDTGAVPADGASLCKAELVGDVVEVTVLAPQAE